MKVLRIVPPKEISLSTTARDIKEHAHPSLQVQGYHCDLKDFLTVFGESPEIVLNSCAYCHNYERSGPNPVIFFPKFAKEISQFPVFAKRRRSGPGFVFETATSKWEFVR